MGDQSNIKVTFQDSANIINYSNIIMVNNSSEEFIIDFGTISPGKEGIEVFGRVALSPGNAKLFLEALSERLSEYETNFGEIKLE